MRGERVPVGYKKKTFVFVLELDPVFQNAMVMAEMQATRGAHTGKNSVSVHVYS
jgi:hypothetical protein